MSLLQFSGYVRRHLSILVECTCVYYRSTYRNEEDHPENETDHPENETDHPVNEMDYHESWNKDCHVKKNYVRQSGRNPGRKFL